MRRTAMQKSVLRHFPAFYPAISSSGFIVYPISSHFVSSSSMISALVNEVLWSRTMAPGWIRPSSFSKASSFVGWSSSYQST